MSYKIVHDRPNCIGCGACAQMCPKYWSLSADGKAMLKGGKAVGDKFELTLSVDEQCNQEAANVCPVEVIKIKELTTTIAKAKTVKTKTKKKSGSLKEKGA